MWYFVQELHSYTVPIISYIVIVVTISNGLFQINKHAGLLFSGSGTALSTVLVIHRLGG